MKIIMFSMHGSGGTELTILCRQSGVEMWMAPPNCQIIRTLTKPEEIPYFEGLGAKFFANDMEVLKALSSDDYAGIILATPEQIDQYRETGTRIPFIIRHGLNSFKKFIKHDTKNFITCCHRAAENLPGCHYFHNRKLIPFEQFRKPECTPEMKANFRSYVHHYEKWKTAYEKFNKLNAMLSTPVVNYGAGTPMGEVPDLPFMDSSRATIHIKDGNAVCNAVVRSMVMRTPVIMDRESFQKCFFDDIKGIIVKDDIQGVAEEIRKIDDSDDYLQEKIEQLDLKQFTWDEDLGVRFRVFIQGLRV